MNKSKVKEIIDKTEVFLLDMDGTIYLDSTPIGDMINTLKKLRKAGKKIVYFTNNSSKTVDEYEKKLKKIGFWEENDEVYSSGVAAIWYLKKYCAGKRVYLLGTDALIKTFKENGIIIDDVNPEIAMLAYDTTIDFPKMKLFNEFLVKGAKYIATHPDMVCPTDGISMPDVGSFIKMFEGTSNRLPEVIIGKPYGHMGEMLEENFSTDRDKITMVGDRIYTDIKFGINCGFNSILVMSGETTEEIYKQSGVEPTLILDSLNDVADLV